MGNLLRLFLIFFAITFTFGSYGQPAVSISNVGTGDFTPVPTRMMGPYAAWPTAIATTIPDQQGTHAPPELAKTAHKKIYCFRFSLHNSDALPQEVVVLLGNNVIRVMELFKETPEGLVSMGRTGNLIPFHDRPHPSFLFYFPLQLPSESRVTYRLYLGALYPPHYLTVNALRPQAFSHMQNNIFTLFGLFAECILLTAFFNLFLYLFVRDKLHLLYFFYAIVNCLVLLSLDNIDMQLLYPSFPVFSAFNKITYSLISLFLCIQVMQAFLGQTKENSRFYVMNQWTKWLLIGLVIPNIILAVWNTSLVVESIRVYTYNLTLIVGIIGVLLASIEKVIQGNRYALFYLAAISLMFLGGIAFLTLNTLRIGRVEPPPSLLEIGLVMETLLISFGILYRFILIKRENEKLAKALHSEKSRSAQLIINTQELEQKRIAQDLHDELGGNLATIKMRLQALSANGTFHQVIQLLDTASETARNIAHNLMPPDFEGTSLDVLLHSYFETYAHQRSPQIQFYISGAQQNFNKQRSLMIYRIVLELTQNIVKHACATEASIQLIYFDHYLEVVAEDNGKGFATGKATGIGLRNIHSRVQYLEGYINIDSNPHGTTVIVRVPFNEIKPA